MSDQRQIVLLAEIDGPGAQFAIGEGSSIRVETLWTVSASEQPTFTGALQAFADRVGVSLSGCSLAISAAGAVGSDVVRITNGRWFISRSGLRCVTGCDVLMLNYVAAAAWGAIDTPVSARRSLGASFRSKGTSAQALLWVADGVGAAAIIPSEAGIRIIGSEAGHATFAAENAAEWALSERMRARFGHCSVERILSLSAQPQNIQPAENGALSDLQRSALASVGGNLVLAYGAWDGLFIGGPGAERLLGRGHDQAFRRRFVAKGPMQKLLEATPVWLLDQRHLALRGTLAALRNAQANGVDLVSEEHRQS
jgi:glucokinase